MKESKNWLIKLFKKWWFPFKSIIRSIFAGTSVFFLSKMFLDKKQNED